MHDKIQKSVVFEYKYHIEAELKLLCKMPEGMSLKIWHINAICDHNTDQRHYHWVNITDSPYNEQCWMPLDGNSTSNPVLSNETGYAYTGITTVWAGLGTCIESVFGVVLNGLVIMALLKNPKLRKEYLTPAIVSLALTDFLYSWHLLLPLSIHFFMG